MQAFDLVPSSPESTELPKQPSKQVKFTKALITSYSFWPVYQASILWAVWLSSCADCQLNGRADVVSAQVITHVKQPVWPGDWIPKTLRNCQWIPYEIARHSLSGPPSSTFLLQWCTQKSRRYLDDKPSIPLKGRQKCMARPPALITSLRGVTDCRWCPPECALETNK